MHEPIGFERGGELLFAFKNTGPPERPIARKLLNADQSPAQITPRYLNRLVRRVVVNKICLNVLAEEVFQTASNETLFVVSCQDCYHTHRVLPNSPEIFPLASDSAVENRFKHNPIVCRQALPIPSLTSYEHTSA